MSAAREDMHRLQDTLEDIREAGLYKEERVIVSPQSAAIEVATEDGVDEVLLFIVDILKEEATLLIPNDRVKDVAEKSFSTAVGGDTAVLPGIMSRKKQIIPALTL